MSKTEKLRTINEYISAFPKEVQTVLESIRSTIHDAAPHAEETIAYNMPTFNLNSNHLVYFSVWKNHIGFYPITTEMETSITELSAHTRSGKGTIQFPLDKPMPLDLVTKITLYRMKEIIDGNIIT